MKLCRAIASLQPWKVHSSGIHIPATSDWRPQPFTWPSKTFSGLHRVCFQMKFDPHGNLQGYLEVRTKLVFVRG